jgi:hypothetical protein
MQRSAFIFWRASFIIKLTMAQPHAFIASQRRVSLYNLPDWCAKPDDDLLIAFRAEVALPQKLQPIRNCATFELAYRALALRANSLFELSTGSIGACSSSGCIRLRKRRSSYRDSTVTWTT